MSRKRRRKRSQRSNPQRPGPTEVVAADAGERDRDEPAPRPRGLFAPRGDRGPYPPFGVSLARGFRAAGSSPAILAVAFLLALSLLVLLLLDRLGGGPDGLRGVLGRLPRTTVAVALIYAIEFALVQGIPTLFAGFGPQLANLGLLAALIGGVLMLVMAPIAAGDGLPAQEALRRSWRAARLPGGRHFGLAIAYFFFYYWLFFNAIRAAALAPATPSVVSWVVALAATFVHVGVLGAFAYRWLVVRDQIPTGPAPRGDGRR